MSLSCEVGRSKHLRCEFKELLFHVRRRRKELFFALIQRVRRLEGEFLRFGRHRFYLDDGEIGFQFYLVPIDGNARRDAPAGQGDRQTFVIVS